MTQVLSTREREVADLVSLGLRAREIAARLSITEQSVKNHKHNIYAKLGVRNAVEMVLALGR